MTMVSARNSAGFGAPNCNCMDRSTACERFAQSQRPWCLGVFQECGSGLLQGGVKATRRKGYIPGEADLWRRKGSFNDPALPGMP